MLRLQHLSSFVVSVDTMKSFFLRLLKANFIAVLLVSTSGGQLVFAQEQPALRGLGEPAAPALRPSLAPLKIKRSKDTPPSNLSPVLEPLRSTVDKSALDKPLTLVGAVQIAEVNYPLILKANAQERASRENITVQKMNEYLPDGLFQVQEVGASRNKMTQIIYGSPVFPGNPGPGFNNINMAPLFFSGAGFNLDWAPLDFGLHKARIQLSKQQYGQAQAQVAVTKLDTQMACANSFLDVVEALQQVKATQENVNSFDQFFKVVQAQVNAELKPGADASLAAAQLANARNQYLRAGMNLDVSKAGLSNSLGMAGVEVSVVDRGLVSEITESSFDSSAPTPEQVPILQASKASLLSAQQQKTVLKKEGYPVFHWLAGFQMRGSSMDTKGKVTWNDAAGFAPVEPNYQVAMIANWNFLDLIRLKFEKKAQDQRILAQHHDYDLVLQNITTEDKKSRARLVTAIEIAKNMPVQVKAAEQAVSQALSRYKVGLGSVAQVAEANQVLAQSRMQEAVAKVAVWRAMLGVASVRGDLRPFLSEAERAQRGI